MRRHHPKPLEWMILPLGVLTPVPAIEAGLGFLGAEFGRLNTPVALDRALPGREPGVVSPLLVSVV